MGTKMNWEQLLADKTQVKRESEPLEFKKYPINDLEKDYKMIISSAAFRRLQDKTQVFPLDKSDFVRTRLTHSLEVSTIARQLGIMVTQNTTAYLPDEFKADKDKLVEKIPSVLSCAGLLYDLGNPPFGHFGEIIIGEWFQKEFQNDKFAYKGNPVRTVLTKQMRKDLENFEGNAQALRILSKIRNKEKSHEINITRGVIGALIKYPTSSTEFTSKKDKDIRKHKLGYFYAEKDSFDSICQETGMRLETEKVARHPLTFLMEAADDIAYSTADLEDALKKGLFTIQEFIEYFESQMGADKKAKLLIENLKERIINLNDDEKIMIAFQNWMDYARGWFMYCVAYNFSKNYREIMNGTFCTELIQGTFHEKSMRIFKDAMGKFVYEDAEIVKLELSAKKILTTLLDDFIYAVIYMDEDDKLNKDKDHKLNKDEDHKPNKDEDHESNKDEVYKLNEVQKKLCNLIPDNLKDDYKGAKGKEESFNLYLRFLMVTDFISGMTDSYAKNLYQELGSVRISV